MIKCIVIDDEPLALDLIENYISKTPFLELIGRYSNPMDAIEVLQNGEVDLLFLDIQMPELTGFDLLNIVKKRPHVIFITAYEEYAIKSYEQDAVDYLLKPISFDRFLKASNKVLNLTKTTAKEGNSANDTHEIELKENYLFVKVDYKIVKIDIGNILYVEGLKDYCKIITTEQRVITRQTMTYIENKLPDNRFIRVHRSYIVALNKIKKIEGSSLVIDDKLIPIGNKYKEDFQKAIAERML